MTTKDYSEKILKTLHRIGVLHVEEGKDLKPVDRAAIEVEHKEISELLTFVDNVLSYIPREERIPKTADLQTYRAFRRRNAVTQSTGATRCWRPTAPIAPEHLSLLVSRCRPD